MLLVLREMGWVCWYVWKPFKNVGEKEGKGCAPQKKAEVKRATPGLGCDVRVKAHGWSRAGPLKHPA